MKVINLARSWPQDPVTLFCSQKLFEETNCNQSKLM